MTTNLPAVYSMPDLEKMALAFAKSGMFGAKTPEQAMALLLLAHGEGLHPAIAMRDFDVIQGRPAKKAEAMLRSFLGAGGKVEWHQLDDECADATFSHPQGGSARITWDMKRAKMAGVGNKDMYNKYPRQMLRSRVVSEGCRTIYPASTSGLYVPEEVVQFGGEKNITPTAGAMQALPIKTQEIVMETAAEVKALLANDQHADAYAMWQNSKFDTDEKVAFWSQLDSKQRGILDRMAQAEEAQNKGVISPAKHKRLEAMIKEFKLDREGLKNWCTVQFGKAHFTELNNDEYRALDTHIASMTTAAASPSSSPATASIPTGSEPASAAATTITEADESVILDLLEAHGVTLAAFLKRAGVKRILDLQAERLTGAMDWIKQQAKGAK